MSRLSSNNGSSAHENEVADLAADVRFWFSALPVVVFLQLSLAASLAARVCCMLSVISTHECIPTRPIAPASDGMVTGALADPTFCNRTAKVAFEVFSSPKRTMSSDHIESGKPFAWRSLLPLGLLGVIVPLLLLLLLLLELRYSTANGCSSFSAV